MWHDKSGHTQTNAVVWLMDFSSDVKDKINRKRQELQNKNESKDKNENDEILGRANALIISKNYDQVLESFLLNDSKDEVDYESHYKNLQFLFEATFHNDSAEYSLHICKKIAIRGSNANTLYNQYMILSLLQPIRFTKEGPIHSSNVTTQPLNSLNKLPEKWIFFNKSIMSEFVNAGKLFTSLQPIMYPLCFSHP
jgi:hypothetical protein